LRALIARTEADVFAAAQSLPSSFFSIAAIGPVSGSLTAGWFGRAWLMRPVLIGGLAAFWLASGAIAMAQPGAAAGVLTARGLAGAPALAIVLGGALLDLALGALVLVRRTMPAAACGMLAVSAAYLLGGTLLAPDLWGDPLGPLVKVVPAMLPAAMLLALAEER